MINALIKKCDLIQIKWMKIGREISGEVRISI